MQWRMISPMSDGMRTDKWLWAVRLAKTRGMAAETCAAGKVKRSGHVIKASSTIRPGDVLHIPFPAGPGARVIEVKSLLEKRVGAPEAQLCYSDLTSKDVFEAQDQWHTAKREGMKGRPTKKNRRDIDHIHGFLD